MDEDALSKLKRLLAERLEGVRLTAPETTEADYDPIIARVMRRVPALRETTQRNLALVAERYLDLVDKPEGQQATVLANSPPTMLLALAHGLMRESYAHRFDDVQRSLAMAKLAHQAASALARTDYLSPGSTADLVGESLDHLGNALRLNSDLAGAERALAAAEAQFDSGTRDRDVRANHLGLLGALRLTQGRAEEAAAIWAQEAAIWRLLKDSDKLGVALIGSGLAICWVDDTERAARLIKEGVKLVKDDRMVFLGLVNLAEALARNGEGFRAWKLLCTAHLIGMMVDMGAGLTRRHRWVEAIAYRCNGELLNAERILTSVRDEYVENRESLRAALASLDLLAVLAAQGKHREVAPLAEATHRILSAEGLEKEALSPLLMLQRAALAEKLTEKLAVKVANYIQRRRHDREAQFG